MKDKELLEFAAKAHANVQWVDNSIETAYWDHDAYDWWNPLTDDGDALRLAVKLNLTVYIEAENCGVITIEWGYGNNGEPTSGIYHEAPEDGDDYSAVRRAIVRAAAEIGKAM